jgi:hypothetical protein
LEESVSRTRTKHISTGAAEKRRMLAKSRHSQRYRVFFILRFSFLPVRTDRPSLTGITECSAYGKESYIRRAMSSQIHYSTMPQTLLVLHIHPTGLKSPRQKSDQNSYIINSSTHKPYRMPLLSKLRSVSARDGN